MAALAWHSPTATPCCRCMVWGGVDLDCACLQGRGEGEEWGCRKRLWGG